jgi:hypothetical protein
MIAEAARRAGLLRRPGPEGCRGESALATIVNNQTI